jgi:phage tail sheath protein FI
MSFNVGLNVVEVDGRVAPSIQAAPTSVAALIIRSPRGLPGQVYRITNWSEYIEHFGGYMDGAYGAYAMRGFIDNGGAVAYVTRVVNADAGDATAATVASDPGSWTLVPDGTLQFATDLAAGPLDVQFTATPATLVGGAGPFNLDDGGGDGIEISFTVNGVVRGPYQFEAADFIALGAATADEVVAVLNREFQGIQAWVEDADNFLRVRTDRRGAGASLEAGAAAAAVLALDDDGLQNGGGNVNDIEAVTAAEAVTVIDAVLNPEGLLVAQDGQRVRVTHPNPGAAGTIQVVDQPTSVHLAFGFDTAVHTGTDGGGAAGAEASANTFPDGGGTALTVTAGYRGVEDPGTWGDNLAIRIAPNTETAGTYDMFVRENGTIVETWEQLNHSTAADAPGQHPETVINDEFTGSKFIIVSEDATDNPVTTDGTAAADADGFVNLENGADDTLSGAELQNAIVAALNRFDVHQVQLVCCPETDSATWVVAALAYCGNRGDCMLVGHTPLGQDAAAAKAYGKGFQGNKVYGTLYFPWIRVADPIGTQKWIPPSGHIMGVYARTERERGIWKAPAGNAARVNGALDIQHHITDAVHTDLVKNGSVNAVRFIPGQGIVIDSSRTLSTSTIWLYVNIRLLFNFVKSSLMGGLRWVVQEPNDETLWNKVKFGSVTPFF